MSPQRAASLNKQRGRTKDVAGIVRQLDYVIEYNRRIRDFAADPELFPSLREVRGALCTQGPCACAVVRMMGV